jgi:hypothetical protein
LKNQARNTCKLAVAVHLPSDPGSPQQPFPAVPGRDAAGKISDEPVTLEAASGAAPVRIVDGRAVDGDEPVKLSGFQAAADRDHGRARLALHRRLHRLGASDLDDDRVVPL